MLRMMDQSSELSEGDPQAHAVDRGSSERRDVMDQTYTCPMHPEVESPSPGRCPKCGMDLVPRDEE